MMKKRPQEEEHGADDEERDQKIPWKKWGAGLGERHEKELGMLKQRGDKV